MITYPHSRTASLPSSNNNNNYNYLTITMTPTMTLYIFSHNTFLTTIAFPSTIPNLFLPNATNTPFTPPNAVLLNAPMDYNALDASNTNTTINPSVAPTSKPLPMDSLFITTTLL
jgi:hypothetical protein